MEPHYADDSATLYLGDALAVGRQLESGSADCIVTSPPYFALRDYAVEPTDWAAMEYVPLPGAHPIEVSAMTCALGLEPDPTAFVGHLVQLFRELRRVLAADGTLWVNLGDTYSSPGGHTDVGASSQLRGGRRVITAQREAPPRARLANLPPKNLIGIPWRTALALQADGWIVRSDVVWAKTSAMPESVADRMARRHEYVFMLAKSQRYWFDLDAVRIPQESVGVKHNGRSGYREGHPSKQTGYTDSQRSLHPLGKNPGTVWSLPSRPFAEAHFAVMPIDLAERCIQAGCKPGGTVLDPFSGSGTTGLAAAKHGRRYVGIDLSREYLDLSIRTRLAQPALDFGGAS